MADATDVAELFYCMKVRVNPILVGGKKAVRQGDTLHVSPAMYDLIRHAATEGELKTILTAIEVVTIAAPPSFYDPLPMVTRGHGRPS